MLPFSSHRWLSKSQQAGFTLMEMMVAGTLALILSLVLFKVIIQSQQMAEQMLMQSNLNSHAREVFELLGDGGVRTADDANGADYADQILGYHGRSTDPEDDAPTAVGRTDSAGDASFRLRLGPEAGNILRTSASQPTFIITCADDDDRLKTCNSDTDTYTVDGYVDEFYSDNATTRSLLVGAQRRLPELTFTVIDPYRVPRSTTLRRFTQDEYSESFWTVFYLHVD